MTTGPSAWFDELPPELSGVCVAKTSSQQHPTPTLTLGHLGNHTEGLTLALGEGNAKPLSKATLQGYVEDRPVPPEGHGPAPLPPASPAPSRSLYFFICKTGLSKSHLYGVAGNATFFFFNGGEIHIIVN